MTILRATVTLVRGQLRPDSKVTITDETGQVLTSGMVPLTGRTSSAEHRIHRAISNCGFFLAQATIEASTERWGDDVAVIRVIAR